MKRNRTFFTGITTRTYDEIGRVITKSVPNIGITVFEYDIKYDIISTVDGIVIGQRQVAEKTTDPKGNTTVKVYDTAGRQKARNVYGTNLISGKIDNQTAYYMYNGHADVTALLNGAGTVIASYYYDAFGNILESNESPNVDNPFRYAGYRFDDETGLHYLNARYYDPATSRMLTEDTYWHPGNMIYGDNPVKINERQDPLGLTIYTYVPDINAIRQSTNLYVYCMNNPIRYTDPTGHRTKEAADKIIKDNAQYIKDAAEEFGVNPAILAACIYTEQRLNVNWIDDLTDRALYFFDTSIGVSQVRISTAKLLEDAGYMPRTESKTRETVRYIGMIRYTETYTITREEAIADKLMDNKTNIRYVAAYLAYWQDIWKDTYPEIGERTDILATLYNLGVFANEPNSNPESNPFGNFAKENYKHIKSLLGID
ncbi:MAG TPA: RHS repeat-associated core domain-containing protein [Clostridiaceae bacterium]|nr:RHS repeat-associated core domain-containing protein [Clostridiaceae bacterium]